MINDMARHSTLMEDLHALRQCKKESLSLKKKRTMPNPISHFILPPLNYGMPTVFPKSNIAYNFSRGNDFILYDKDSDHSYSK